jgi:hypothetical protein
MKKTVLLGALGFLGFMALLASVPPAFAGEVYVPFAANKTLNGATYRTRVWVTNTSTTVQKAGVRFLDENADGTQAGAPQSVNVGAGATVVLTNVAPAQKNGMLEISGAPSLVVTSRLDVQATDGAPLASINVPVVAVANVIGAGKTAELQGLERTQRGTFTDYGILNLNSTAAQCTIKAYRSNNTQIAQTVVITLPPLSVRHFNEALATLGQTFIVDVRIETSCDKQFFPYALLYKPGFSETAFMTPSQTLDGDLVTGAGGGGGGGGGQDGSVVFQQTGTYLAAKQGASYKSFTLPLVDGVRYKKATVDFDMFIDRFPKGLFAGVMSLRRNDRTLFYGLIIRGDRQKTVLDMGIKDDVVTGGNGGPWAERSNFHVNIDYDTVSGDLTFKVYQANALVQTLTGRLNHPDLVQSNNVVSIDFGMTGIADGAYFPPVGWSFSNLKVVFVP